MSDVLHSLCAAAAVVAVVGLIVWGANSCSVQETALREACIRAGGSVVVSQNMSSHCIRGGGVVQP